MKLMKWFLASIVAVAALSCDNDKPTSQYNANVNFNLPNIDTAVVIKIHPKSAEPVDTIILSEDHKGHFGINIDTPSFYSMVLNNNSAFTIFLEKGSNINVTENTGEGDKFLIEGSAISSRIEKLFTYQTQFQKEIGELNTLSQGADKKKMDSIMSVAQMIDAAFKQKIANYIVEKPGSPEALLAVYQGVGNRMIFDLYNDYDIFKMVHDSLSESDVNLSSHLSFLKDNLKRTQAIPFSLPDEKGNMVNFADYLGKWTVLDFWASWCKPCRIMNPELVKMHKDYPNLQMVSVSLDGVPNQKEPKKEWLKAIKDDKITWTNLSDLKGAQTEVVSLYQFRSIPQTLLINPEGRIVGKNLPIDQVRAILDKELK
jgi:thiol-disulfide isomerase/thioredoxin